MGAVFCLQPISIPLLPFQRIATPFRCLHPRRASKRALALCCRKKRCRGEEVQPGFLARTVPRTEAPSRPGPAL